MTVVKTYKWQEKFIEKVCKLLTRGAWYLSGDCIKWKMDNFVKKKYTKQSSRLKRVIFVRTLGTYFNRQLKVMTIVNTQKLQV